MALLFFCPPHPVRALRRVGRHSPSSHIRPLGQPGAHLRIATRPVAFPQTRKTREPVIACPMGRESLVPQTVASSYPVAGPFATVPQSRKNLDRATVNPVGRESLVAASRCHLRSRCWLLCLHSAKLENFGRATIDRLRHSACQLILDEKSCCSPHPDPWGAQSKREKIQRTTRQAPRPPRSRRRFLLAPLPRSSLAPSGRPVAPLAQGARKFLWAQTVVARCPDDGRLGVLPENRKMMAGPGGQPPFTRPVKNTLSFQRVRKKVATRRPAPGCSRPVAAFPDNWKN